MRYGGDELITAIITELETTSPVVYSGNPVPIYSEVPITVTFPYVAVTPYSVVEIDGNKTRENHQITVQIDVVTKFKTGAGGFGASQNISNQILSTLRTKGDGLTLANDFSIYGQTLSTIQPLREAEKNGTYFRTIILMDFKVSDDQ